MENKPEELFEVLANPRSATRFRKVGIGCLFLFRFLHGFGIYALDDAVSLGGECFGMSAYQMRVLFIVHFANSYISPIIAALFSDLRVGKYQAILFSAGLRIFAALAHLVIAIVFTMIDKFTMNPTLKSALFGIYLFFLMFEFVGLEFHKVLIFPFGMQQVNQEDDTAIGSAARWLVWFAELAMVVSALSQGQLRSRFKHNHMLMNGIVRVIVTGLMISVFIIGKGQYHIRASDGTASIKVIWEAIKAKLFTRTRLRNLDDPGNEDSDQFEVYFRRKVYRLILRRFGLTVVFLASVGISQVVYFKMLFIKVNGWRATYTEESFSAGYMTLVVFVPTIVLIPLWECVITWRRRRQHLGNRKVINYKVIGTGLLLCALAALLVGLVFHYKQLDHTLSRLWQIPAYLCLGSMTVFTYTKVLQFCYTESFKGLECLNTSLLYSLWMLLYSTITWTEVVWNHNLSNIEMFFYGMAACMFGVVILVYIPVCIWYHKIRMEIAVTTTSYPGPNYGTLTGSRFFSNEDFKGRCHQAEQEDGSNDVM